MEKLKNILYGLVIITAFILLILFTKNCDNKSLLNIKPKSDTVTIVEHTRDTVWVKDTTFVFKPKYIIKPIVYTDTIYKPSPIDTNLFKRIYVYKDTLEDSNLVIYRTNHIQGLLKASELSYKLKVPLKIIDSVKVLTFINKKPIFVVNSGLNISKVNITPYIGLGFGNQSFSIGYELINKTPSINYTYTIYTKYK